MCEECQRRNLATVYRAGRRRKHEEAWSMPCRQDDRLTDLVIRSAPVTDDASSQRTRRKPKRPAPRREVR
jgi:hypothetical protein